MIRLGPRHVAVPAETHARVLWLLGRQSDPPLQNVKKDTKTMMGVRGCFQNGASRQGGGLAVSGVIFGCPRLGESAAGIQWAQPREPAPRPAVHSPSRWRMIWPKVSVVPQLRNSCSLVFFFLKKSTTLTNLFHL